MASSIANDAAGQTSKEDLPLLRPASDAASAKNASSFKLTFYVIIVSLTAAMSGLCFGFEIGIIDTVLAMRSFRIFFGTWYWDDKTSTLLPTAHKDDTEGTIVSSFLLGAMAGACIVSWLAEVLGRRVTLIVGAATFCAGALTQTFASGLAMLLGGRAISGASIGVLSMAAPLYVSEAAPPAVRGRLVACVQLLITVGILLASIVNSVLYTLDSSLSGDTPWRAALGAQVIPGGILALLLLCMPESPRWLLSVGKEAQAIRVLAKLRGQASDSATIMQEVEGIQRQVEAEAGDHSAKDLRHWLSGWGALCGRQARKRVAIACTLQLFQQATGINVVLYYAARLFGELGVPESHAATTLVAVNAALLVVGTVPGIALIDKPSVGRRKLLLSGAAAMCAMHACIAIAVLAVGPAGDGSASPAQQAAGWVAVAAMLAFTVAFSATWGPAVWVVQSEIFPTAAERTRGGSLATLTNWTANAIIGRVAPLILTAAGPWTYAGFSVICALMGGYTWAVLPETGGKTLEEMGDILS